MIKFSLSIVQRPTAPKSNTINAYVRVRLKSATQKFKPIEVSTGLKCEKKQWDQKAGQFKGKNPKAQAKNNRLTQFQADVMTAFNNCNSAGSFDLNKFKLIIGCKDATAEKECTIQDLFTDYKAKLGSDLSENRLGRYDLTEKKFLTSLAIQNKGKAPRPQDVTRDHLLHFKSQLQQQGAGYNTVINYLKIVKAVFREAVRSKVVKEFPFTDCSTVHAKANRVYLTSEELERIKAIPDQQLTQRQCLIRDLFDFACETGVGYSDLVTLETEHMVTSLQGTMLVKTRCKTKEVFRSPLSDHALRLIEKYKDMPKKKNRLFWVPCLNDYNRDLQAIRHLAQIQKPLTSHIARHTKACLYLQGGGSIYTLAAILGHSTVRTTQLYGKLQDNGIISEAKQVFRNLLNRDASIIPINRPKNGYEDGTAKQANG